MIFAKMWFLGWWVLSLLLAGAVGFLVRWAYEEYKAQHSDPELDRIEQSERNLLALQQKERRFETYRKSFESREEA